MPELTSDLARFAPYVLDYPTVTLRTPTSFLYWQETEFGLKPTIRISHLTIRNGPDDTVVALSRALTRSRFLARDRQSQPIGWSHRLQGLVHPKAWYEAGV